MHFRNLMGWLTCSLPTKRKSRQNGVKRASGVSLYSIQGRHSVWSNALHSVHGINGELITTCVGITRQMAMHFIMKKILTFHGK